MTFFADQTIPETHPTEGIEPEYFDQADIDSLLATKSAIIRSGKFKRDSAKREVRMEWEYATSHPYSQPLNAYLSDTTTYTMPKQY